MLINKEIKIKCKNCKEDITNKNSIFCSRRCNNLFKKGKKFDELYPKEKAIIIKEKISSASKGHIVSEETKKKIRDNLNERGNPMKNKETIEKMRKSKIGKPTWNKGLNKKIDTRIDYNRPTSFKKGRIVTNEEKEKKRKSMLGEKSHLWKGGKTKWNSLLRQRAKYKEWRKKVFERDNYTCQNKNCLFCGNLKGSFLNAHHIKSWNNHPELRYDLENGITYCEEFHIKSKKFHKGIAGKSYFKRFLRIIPTTHLIPKEDILRICEEERPDIIGVELCETRLNQLLIAPEQREVKQDDSIIGKISSAIRKKAKEKNINYASDMVTASAYALEKNIPLVLVDRSIIEISNLMNKIPKEEMMGFIKELQMFEQMDLKESIKNIKEEEVINELKTKYPIAYEFLIVSRELFIVKNILKTLIEYPNKKFLVFVGKGHLKSIEKELEIGNN